MAAASGAGPTLRMRGERDELPVADALGDGRRREPRPPRALVEQQRAQREGEPGGHAQHCQGDGQRRVDGPDRERGDCGAVACDGAEQAERRDEREVGECEPPIAP